MTYGYDGNGTVPPPAWWRRRTDGTSSGPSWQLIATAALAVVAALVGFLWVSHDRRIEALETNDGAQEVKLAVQGTQLLLIDENLKTLMRHFDLKPTEAGPPRGGRR